MLFTRLTTLAAGLLLFASAANATTYIVGVTVIDTTAYGQSRGDLINHVLVLEGEKIAAILPEGDLPELVDGDVLVDATGLFAVPGYVDGFGTMKQNGFREAYLRAGVTSVVTPMEGRRGEVTWPEGGIVPELIMVASVGREALETEALLRRIGQIDADRYKLLHLMGQITNEQLGPVIDLAKRRGFVVLGELVHADPSLAVQLGIDFLVHTQRYTVELAQLPLRQALAADPFAEALDGPKWLYYDALHNLEAPDIRPLARQLATPTAALMPTAALTSTARQDSANPWFDPLAESVLPELIHCSPDRQTGKLPVSEERLAAHGRLGQTVDTIETVFKEAGARYLAGSGANIFGTLPGVSLHWELTWLHEHLRLSPREVLAAVTTNYSYTFNWPERFLLAPGSRADLVLLSEDPRESVAALRSVSSIFVAGRHLSHDDLWRDFDDASTPSAQLRDDLPEPCAFD